MLELYQTETCPYCQKVREKLSEVGVSYVIHNPRRGGKSGGDVTNQQTYDELIEFGGQDQVPFLVDTTRSNSVYESDDIIEYLEKHYAGKEIEADSGFFDYARDPDEITGGRDERVAAIRQALGELEGTGATTDT